MKYLAIIVGLLLVIPSYGQRKKKDDELGEVPYYIEGITYSLPRTGIRVYVKARSEIFKPGPYAGYAEQLLGLKDVKTRPEKKWILTEVKIEAFSEPDPEQVYKAMGEPALMLNLTADGRIAGINLQEEMEYTTVVKTNKVLQSPDIEDGFSFDNFTDTPFYIPGDSSNNFRLIRVEPEQKAAEAAKRVLDLRVHRYDMAAGMMDTPHPDGEAYKISLEELVRMEKNYLSLFAGRKTYKEDVFCFDYIPKSSNGNGEVIFRVSDDNGVVPATDLSGRPVMIEFEIEKNLVEKYSEMSTSENPSAGESGVFYRMPAMATVKILDNLNIVSTARIPVAQFGVVAPLPEEFLQGEYKVKYHVETGTIQSVFNQ